MSVLVVTSLGDIVVDLHTDRCPLTTKNFLKLCKMKYYNGCLFHKVEKDFLAQTGDRSGMGDGGDSVYKFLYGDQARFFDDEIHPELKHKRMGTVAMASAGKNLSASQFYFTLRDDLDYLDGKHTVFGVVEEQEGLETLGKINEAYADDKGRPYKNIRIKHTYILDDPFPDPLQLSDFIPEKSPEGKPDDEKAAERLEDNWVPLDEKLGPAELEELIRSKEARTNAAILESIGDIPDADIKPPENVLFVCKLNPVTQDEDLHTIFSRFGNVTSADVIRDYKTGDSLCYAFIEFETNESCELAYTKMDNTLIDDRRIHVDFSQSVAKLWSQYRHGRRRETKGSGCFKCGASDHIARDCPQDSRVKEKASKYIVKEDNRQRGGNQSYDMVFDEHDNNLGSRHQVQGDDMGYKKQKIEKKHSEDSGQKGSSRQTSEPWNSKNSHDYKSRAYRETNRQLGKRSAGDYHTDKDSRGRDDERRSRVPDRHRYKEEVRRHGKEDIFSKTDAKSSRERRDALGPLNIRDEKNRWEHSYGRNGWEKRTSRDSESKEGKMERSNEEKSRKHHKRSHDDSNVLRSPSDHDDYDIRERKHRYEKRR